MKCKAFPSLLLAALLFLLLLIRILVRLLTRLLFCRCCCCCCCFFIVPCAGKILQRHKREWKSLRSKLNDLKAHKKAMGHGTLAKKDAKKDVAKEIKSMEEAMRSVSPRLNVRKPFLGGHLVAPAPGTAQNIAARPPLMSIPLPDLRPGLRLLTADIFSDQDSPRQRIGGLRRKTSGLSSPKCIL